MEESTALIGILKYAKTVMRLILRKTVSTKNKSRKGYTSRIEKDIKNATDIIILRTEKYNKRNLPPDPNWENRRNNVIYDVHKMSEEMRKIKRTVNLVDIFSSLMDILSSILGIFGACFAPLSMYISFAFLILALGTSILGKGSYIYIESVEVKKIRTKCEKAKKALDEDAELFQKIKGDTFCEDLKGFTSNMVKSEDEEKMALTAAGIEVSGVLVEALMYIVAAGVMFKYSGTANEDSETYNLAESFFYQGATWGSIVLGIFCYIIGIATDLWYIIERLFHIFKGSNTHSSKAMANLSKQLKLERKKLME